MSVYENDANLPKLPLPMVNITCDGIISQMQPFCPESEWEATWRTAADMKGQAQMLQKFLREYFEGLGGNLNWLRSFLDDSILADRESLPMRGNRAFRLRGERWGLQPLPTLILGFCRFFQRLGTGDLSPETDGSSSLSMDSLRNMAYTRIPCAHRDILHHVVLSGPLRVAVVKNGHWFSMTVSDASGKLFSEHTVAKALYAIGEIGSELMEEPAVGASTSVDRDQAAELRNRILAHHVNRNSLADLEECLFVVSLNDRYCGDSFGHDLLVGDAADRWYDKSLQLIRGPRGELGMNVERAGCDSGFWIYALNQVDQYIRDGLIQTESPAGSSVRHLPFYVDKELGQDLSGARQKHLDKSRDMQFVFELLDSVDGEHFETLEVDPDFLMQIVFQAAYQKIAGELPTACETVPVRRFYQGRTDIVRSASVQSAGFVKALLEDNDSPNLRKLYDAAEEEYKRRRRWIGEGASPDRHMFGLTSMAGIFEHAPENTALPELLSNPIYLASMRKVVFSCSATAPCVNFLAIAPAEAGGLGVGYATAKDGLQLAVSSGVDSKVSAQEFCREIRQIIDAVVISLQK